MLTDEELKRYQRHFEIAGWNHETQQKLGDATVFVAGAGGLGSPVLYYLAAAGIGKIIFCDRDIVDVSNLNRQILYCADDIGAEKAYTAGQRLHKLNKNITLVPLQGEIDYSLAGQLAECDLIIDCLDNFEARLILNSISVEKRIPMVHAGVNEFYSQITFLKPGETPCLACFIEDKKYLSGKGILGATAGITGSMQALEAVKYLTGTGELLLNRILFIDMKYLSFNIMKISRNPRCKICAKLYEV